MVSCVSSRRSLLVDAELSVCVCECCFSPTLSWRDMQHIVVMSSRTQPLRDAYWIVNGVGRQGIDTRVLVWFSDGE